MYIKNYTSLCVHLLNYQREGEEKIMSEKCSSTQFLSHHAKPYLGVIFMQFCSSIMSIITKIALTQGMSQHVLVAYRMVVATSLIAPFAIVLERYLNFSLNALVLFVCKSSTN